MTISKATLQAEMKLAMKARDQVRLSTIRAILSAFQYEEMERKVDALPETTCLELVQRELKKRNEEVDFAKQAQRPELLEKLSQEIACIESFLPKRLSDQELSAAIAQLHAADSSLNMGALMKILKERYPGQYDAKLASELVKKLLG